MAKAILGRVGWSIIIVLASTVLVFVILRVLPGDPVLARLGASTQIDDATLQLLREQAGLTGPLYQQYITWFIHALGGNLGSSYFSQEPVTTLIAVRLPVTLEVTAIAVLFTLIISIPLAVWAAARPDSVVNRMIGLVTSVGMAVPLFVVGIVLILVFALGLHVLPARGYVSFSEDPTQNLTLMFLPALTLSLVASPQLARFLRASMLDLWQADFVRTAQGKGAPDWVVVVKHILRNALVPFLTRLGVIIGYTLGGVVVVEYMFGLPGLGSLAIDSANKRDYAVLQGVVLVIVVLFILTTLVVDLVHRIIDPRLRKQAARG